MSIKFAASSRLEELHEGGADTEMADLQEVQIKALAQVWKPSGSNTDLCRLSLILRGYETNPQEDEEGRFFLREGGLAFAAPTWRVWISEDPHEGLIERFKEARQDLAEFLNDLSHRVEGSANPSEFGITWIEAEVLERINVWANAKGELEEFENWEGFVE